MARLAEGMKDSGLLRDFYLDETEGARAFRAYLHGGATNVRAMGISSDGVGGFLVPEGFYYKVLSGQSSCD